MDVKRIRTTLIIVASVGALSFLFGSRFVLLGTWPNAPDWIEKLWLTVTGFGIGVVTSCLVIFVVVQSLVKQ